MLAGILWCAIYVLTMLCVGCAVTALILRRQRRSIAELVGVIVTLGPGCTGMLLLAGSVLGLRPGRIELLIIMLAAVASLVPLIRSKAFPLPQRPASLDRPLALNLLILLTLPIVVGAIGFCAMVSLAYSTFNWDSFVIWGFKAKVLYYDALTPRPWYFSDLRLSFSHLDYPLLMPMMIAGAYGAMHDVWEQAGKIAIPILFAGQTLLIYSGARRFIPRFAAVPVTALLIGTGWIVEQSGMADADMVLTTFRAGAVAYLIRWIEQREQPDAILCAIFTVLAAYMKNEGLPLAVITGAVMALFAIRRVEGQRRWLHVALFAAIVAIPILAWLAWRAGLPHSDENYPGQMRWSTITSNASRLWLVMRAYGSSMGLNLHVTPLWGWFWLSVPLVALLGLGAFLRPAAQALWVMLLAHLALYTFAYIITPLDPVELMRNSLDRLLTHAAPTAALIIAVHWSAVLPPEDGASQPDST